MQHQITINILIAVLYLLVGWFLYTMLDRKSSENYDINEQQNPEFPPFNEQQNPDFDPLHFGPPPPLPCRPCPERVSCPPCPPCPRR